MEMVQPKETFEQVLDKVKTERGLDCTYVVEEK